ncbi:MAG: NGG1p interacting factor NIF3 [Candidatus Auribacterota bacterium]|jgi:putative NIF3 family GTP cyclohydrolase 1 type 2|nr:NGG1p interacting factor NIF3 [Candidatus Auribacterota bacterium]
MRIKDIFDIAIEFGKQKDPRGKDGVEDELKRLRETYDAMSESAKESFDKSRLSNPYADSGILYGDPEKEVKSLMLGIDIEVGELVLADRLREKRGGNLDLVIAHHPEGRSLTGFYNVMYMQADILYKFGVPINIAEALIEERVKEVEKGIMPLNHHRAVDCARLLDIPMLNLHTPADNCVVDFLQTHLEEKSPRVVRDVIKILEEIPEYKIASENNTPPKVICGSENHRVGKIFVDMTGGTEGSKKNYEKLAVSGVGTIVAMHMTKDHICEAEKYNINAIIAGHISSDNLGLNLLIDKITENEKLEIIPCSGFYRVER